MIANASAKNANAVIAQLGIRGRGIRRVTCEA